MMLFAQYRCSNRCEATEQYQSVRCATALVQARSMRPAASRVERGSSSRDEATEVGFLANPSESRRRILTIISITRRAARPRAPLNISNQVQHILVCQTPDDAAQCAMKASMPHT